MRLIIRVCCDNSGQLPMMSGFEFDLDLDLDLVSYGFLASLSVTA